MTIHYLKTLPTYFDAVESGEKTFEVRRDDRGFQRGDIVVLVKIHGNSFERIDHRIYDAEEWESKFGLKQRYGYHAVRRVGWILTGGQYGVEPGHIVFSLAPFDDEG